MRRTQKIDHSDWLPEALNLTPEQFEAEMRLVVAEHLCRRETLSTGAAAVFAGISKPEFLQRMGEFGVPAFGLSPDELESGQDSPQHGPRPFTDPLTKSD